MNEPISFVETFSNEQWKNCNYLIVRPITVGLQIFFMDLCPLLFDTGRPGSNGPNTSLPNHEHTSQGCVCVGKGVLIKTEVFLKNVHTTRI